MDLTAEQQKEFESAFEILNQEHDGSVTAKELGVVMRALGRSPTDSELMDMINEVDLDGNGSIELPEFINMITSKLSNTDKEDELRDAFHIFDKDNTGYITGDQLRTVMAALGQKLNEDEVEEMIREADLDLDGRLSFEEFVNMMTTT